MVRKRPKANGLSTSGTSASVPTQPKPKTPRRRTRRANENFDGKLSHASPISPHSKITKYFHPEEDELKPCDDLARPMMILRTSPRKLLTQANLNASVLPPPPPQGLSAAKPSKLPPSPQKGLCAAATTGGTLSTAATTVMPSPQQPSRTQVATPHKITSPTTAIVRSSPSSALSTLSINSPGGHHHPPLGSVSGGGVKKSKRCLNPLVNNQVGGGGFHGNRQSGQQSRITEFFPVRRSVRKTKKAVQQERQKSLEKAVLNQQEDGLEVHMFEGKGRGIVTTRPFHRGEFVVEYAGQLIPLEVAREREALYARDQNTGCYMYYFRHGNSQYCVDATAESPRLGRLVNHSRSGNLTTKTIEINHEPHLVLIAREDIAAGTEVTYDYGDRSKESLRYHPWLLN